ncbi:MAG: hypothetical protein EKK44_08625, partial [Methylobacterium sp.]
RLGADAVRYTFIVTDFHHLFLAGLPAHWVITSPRKEHFETIGRAATKVHFSGLNNKCGSVAFS